MSSKISRLLGVGLVVAVLASLLVAGVPASASTLGWSAEVNGTFPGLPIAAGSDIVDVAVAGNGTTIYAAGGTFVMASAGVNYMLAKSTNSGTTWAGITAPAGATSVYKIALAPDVADGSWIAVLAIVAGVPEVFISTNGGVSWGPVGGMPGAAIATGLDMNDLAISPAVSGTYTIGVVGDNGSMAKLWTFDVGGLFPTGWTDATGGAGFDTAQTAAYAVAFSPAYVGDKTIAIVSANGTLVKEQLFSKSALKWNDQVYGTSWINATFGSGAVVTSTMATVAGAAIALDPGYRGNDFTKVSYVGVNGTTGTGVAGLWRLIDSAAASIMGPVTSKIGSVAVNTAGDKLVAGAVGTNGVFRVASPATATAGASLNNPAKGPAYAGVSAVSVGFAGTSVVAGTSGTESAFSVSTDDGKDFSDISLVDSPFAPVDFTVSADGSKIYLESYNTGASVASLWKKTTAWARVFVMQDTAAADFVVRIAPENSDVVYLAEVQGTNASGMWYSNDGGATTWTSWLANVGVPVQDMDVESASTVWVLSDTGVVTKSTTAGFSWTTSTNLAWGVNGANTIDVIAANSVIVTGAAGQVTYTGDGGTTWTSIPAGAGAAAAWATADKLSTGGNIYAVSGQTISRYTIGTSTAFAPIKSGTIGTGMGIALGGTTLYVITDNTSNSLLYRTLTPSAPVPGWNTPSGLLGDITATFAGNVLRFTDVPRGFFVTVGTDKNPKLWAFSDINTALVGSNIAIESFLDTLTLAGPTLTGPANGTTIAVNTQSGQAMDVAYTWSQLSTANKYDLQVALDSAFTQPLTSSTSGSFEVVTSGAPSVTVLIGPNVAGPSGNKIVYQPDTTYYWRVRVDPTGPVDSPWSTSGNFKIGSLAPLKLVTPAPGASDVLINPDFSWTTVTGATNYEIFVSDDPTFAVITFSANSPQAVYASTEALAYSTTYYWRVRASAPASAVTPFAYGIFTTQAKPTTPTPPITVTQPGPTTITVSVPPSVNVVPNYLLWIIIGIGAVLVIALIVLIVRTRRSS